MYLVLLTNHFHICSVACLCSLILTVSDFISFFPLPEDSWQIAQILRLVTTCLINLKHITMEVLTYC